MAKTVAVLGGGIGGLTAAHELAERGFEVTVYDNRDLWGGKARSLTCDDSGTEGRTDLPGEHGFRFFPGFYKHVIDTMARIPFGEGCVKDNLTVASYEMAALFEKASAILLARFPKSLEDLKVVFQEMTNSLGISLEERLFFSERLLVLATSCKDRFEKEFEYVPYWKFIDAEHHSALYQRYLGQGLTRSLVANRAHEASTRTVGTTLLQSLYQLIEPGTTYDRLLNAPTNDAWLFPWVHYLTGLGVKFINHAQILNFNMDAAGTSIASVRCSFPPVIKPGADPQTEIFDIQADYYVSAVPVESMKYMTNSQMKDAAPSLANLDQLHTAWMAGIQVYLHEDVPVVNGHILFFDSPWALTAVSQAQFWKDYDWSKVGDGTVKGILSIDISEWNEKGQFTGKTATESCREDIESEVWQELKGSLNVDGKTILVDQNLDTWFLDPDIIDPNTPGRPTQAFNTEPLLINTAGSLQYRPDAFVPGIPNLFLASDYVKTYTDLATMEAANEAGRRAANGILKAEGSNLKPAELWPYSQPFLLKLPQEADQLRFDMGLPNIFDTLNAKPTTEKGGPSATIASAPPVPPAPAAKAQG